MTTVAKLVETVIENNEEIRVYITVSTKLGVSINTNADFYKIWES